MINEPELSTSPERPDWETLQRPFQSDYPKKIEFMVEGFSARPVFEMDTKADPLPRRSLIEDIVQLGRYFINLSCPKLIGFLTQRECMTFSLYELVAGEERQFQRLGVINLPPLKGEEVYSVTSLADSDTIWIGTPSSSAKSEFLIFRYGTDSIGIEMVEGERNEVVSLIKSPRCDAFVANISQVNHKEAFPNTVTLLEDQAQYPYEIGIYHPSQNNAGPGYFFRMEFFRVPILTEVEVNLLHRLAMMYYNGEDPSINIDYSFVPVLVANGDKMTLAIYRRVDPDNDRLILRRDMVLVLPNLKLLGNQCRFVIGFDVDESPSNDSCRVRIMVKGFSSYDLDHDCFTRRLTFTETDVLLHDGEELREQFPLTTAD